MGSTIDDYRRKRDFKRTPEPAPGKVRRRGGPAAFVVHRHDARNLHYDLRLEMDGVLKSWAVPRGFSFDPQVKRLAVRTEDHPMEYLSFEGVIPRGEYGAGSMTIFDRGRYDLLGPDGEGGLDAGKLEITLYGRRLRGEWHLVRTKRGEGREWLLFKATDRYARGSDEPALGGDLGAAVEGAPPKTLRFMTPGAEVAPFTDPDWVFEMEFEGLRTFAVKEDDSITLRGSGRRALARRVPQIIAELGTIRATSAVLDGVLVVTDDAGRPSRARLDAFLAGEGDARPQLYLFDLLFYDELDLRPVALIDRKAQLRSLLRPSRNLLFVDHVLARGDTLVAALSQGGLAGAIAKHAKSGYRSGARPEWRSIPVEPGEVAPGRSVHDLLSPDGAPGVPAVRGFKITNAKKVLWPRDGYTKGELLNYYDQVAEYILPHLKDRPVHMRRMPDGVDAEAFYQRRAPDHLPDWFETVDVTSHTDGEVTRHMICNDRESLLYLANLASIDLHPWLSRRPTLDEPDVAVLDLDPTDAPFSHVVKVARAIGKLLDAIGLQGHPKTSGATGLHVYIPLEPGYTYDQTRIFCEAVARVIAKDLKSIASIVRDPARRIGKVYIDFLQNRRGQTVVPPYTVRPVPGARVSAPLTWNELDADLTPDAFTITTILPRLARVGDLFRPVLTDAQPLLPAIEALESYARS